MNRNLKILIAEDRSDKIELVKAWTQLIVRFINSDIEITFEVVRSIQEYRQMGSPVDFDLAFIDQYLETDELPTFVSERLRFEGKGRYQAPMSAVGAYIVYKISENNQDLYDRTFSISMEGVLNVKDRNHILHELNKDEFMEKVKPSLEFVIKEIVGDINVK